MDKLKIYVDTPRSPRMPPVVDVNNTDLMLGVVVLTLVGACVLGGIIWTVWF
jgi:hypothetical protein